MSEKIFTAREVLTYLYAESKWTEDVDGDCEDGAQRVYVNHDVRIRDSLLEELLDMAGIKKASIYETPLERLARANEEEERRRVSMGTPKLKAFEDASHEGNSAKYHTGKPCIEKGCPEPAGTWWSPHWCFRHNIERIHRIDAGLNDVILSNRLRRMVDDETATLRAYCERLQKERDAAALIVWRRITPDDHVHGKEVLLSRGQPYVTRIGRWFDARTVDRGQGHVRPYKYPAGWYVDGGFSPMKDGMEPLWIADIPPAPSAPADRPTLGDTHGT